MDRGGKIVRVSAVGILVNVILVGFKAAVGAVTGSIAIIMDAVNNLSDALSSAITIVGTKLAGRRPDRDHPFGHGQIEYVTSVTIAVIVILAGAAALRESVMKIIEPRPASYTIASLAIIAAAVGAKLLLGRFFRRKGAELNCEALTASGADALFDAAISFSTLLAAVISMVWHINPEGWLGAVISILMLRTGVQLLMTSLGEIIGFRVDSDLAQRLKERLCRCPGVLGAYDLTLHRYGPERIIGSVHVEVPEDMTAREIHGLTRRLTEEVYRDFGIALTVGIYASNAGDGAFDQMKESLDKIISDYPEILQMHGFYVDTDNMSVFFDLIVDFKVKNSEELRDMVVARMRELYPDYTFRVMLDSDVSD